METWQVKMWKRDFLGMLYWSSHFIELIVKLDNCSNLLERCYHFPKVEGRWAKSIGRGQKHFCQLIKALAETLLTKLVKATNPPLWLLYATSSPSIKDRLRFSKILLPSLNRSEQSHCHNIGIQSRNDRWVRFQISDWSSARNPKLLSVETHHHMIEMNMSVLYCMG